MGLKNATFGRAERLSKETREKYGLPESGLVIIETKNPELREDITLIGTGGIREHLLKFGPFKDVQINEE